MNKTLQDKFINLVCRLSPENLTCDGECSPWEVKQRQSQIHREWRELERQAGRTVSYEEIETAMIAEYR